MSIVDRASPLRLPIVVNSKTGMSPNFQPALPRVIHWRTRWAEFMALNEELLGMIGAYARRSAQWRSSAGRAASRDRGVPFRVHFPFALPVALVLRLLEEGDVGGLALAYRRNRAHLAPWEPVRTADFFTVGAQRDAVEARLAQYAAGVTLPLVVP